MDEADFFLMQWQLNNRGEWLHSSGKLRALPPVEQHRRDLCACPVCHPDRWAEPGYHEREMKRLREKAMKDWDAMG